MWKIPDKWIPLGNCVCGQAIQASADDECAVMHAEPTCEKFRELDPYEFLRYVRRSRGIPDSEVEK